MNLWQVGCILNYKNMKTTIISLLFLFSLSTLFSQDVDILKNYNGDFENGITFWRFFEVPDNIGSSWESTNDAINGAKAMKLTWVEADASVADRGFDNWSARVPVIEGTEYTVKAFMKSDEATGLKVNMLLGFFNSSGGVLYPQYSTERALTNSYAEHELIVTAPADAATCWIAFRMYSTSNQRPAGTIYLDNVRLIGPSTALAPRLMATTLTSDDITIASIDVTEAPYNALNDGSVDATSAIQDAINRASVAGGAVVFIPAGSYRLDGNLNIPERVTLRGEWESPENGNGVKGTILMPYANKGSEGADPFVSVQRGAGIRNLSIWYPEQDAASVSPYPWTIHCHPDGDAGTGDNTSVINVSLVNSYNGIKVGPNWNELHYIRNVYGTPLKQGIWLSQTTDIGRIFNVHFGPKYWSASGLSNSPGEETILSWTQANATGVIMGRSDWEYIYDLSLTGYHIGIQIIKYSDFGPNGVIYGLNIEKSVIGIDLVNVNGIGWAISNAIIKVEGENSACVRTGSAYNSTVQFNTCTFGGDPKIAVEFSTSSTGRLSFQNCTFENWGQTEDSPAINCTKGSVSLLGNTFLLDKLHLSLGTGVRNSQILDNSFPTEFKIDNQSSGEILISHEDLNFSKQEVPPHPYAAIPRPAKDDLFSIIDYGAIPDGSTDNTLAFQNALDAAGLNGGGTVYIPAGMFKIASHITVPTGVELRGIWDVPHHTTSRGSVLLAYEGKDNAEGTPFISLETGSGVRGFTIWYPEQSTQDFFPYPWSIQTLGEDCWIKDVTLGNPYQAVDMASYPSAGHIVSYLAAAPLKSGISIDKNTGEGWIEIAQFNPHYWMRSSGYPRTTDLNFNAIITYQQTNLEAFKIASATNEHIMGTFVFAAKRGIYLAPDDGNSNIDVILHGTDAGDNAVYLENKAGSNVNFVNTQLVLLGTSQNGIITTADDFEADVSFYNSISWGGPGPTANFNGNGNVLIQQMHTINGKFQFNSGNTRLENIKISSSLNPQYIIGAGISGIKIFGSYSANGFINYNYADDKSIVEMDYNYRINQKLASVSTGWESNDTKNQWENTLYGHKDFVMDDPLAFQCESTELETAYTGSACLKVIGSKIESDVALYKIIDFRTAVFYNSTMTYWVKPQDESGKGAYIDLLFTDGTRLSELSPLADDGLALNAARGAIGEWIEVNCAIGDYAHGKVIQTVLVGANLDTDDIYSFLMDDLSIEGVVSVEPSLADNSGLYISQNYPNPFSNYTSIDFNLNKSGLVSFTVFDIRGNKIAIIADELHYNAGSYQLNWIPDNLESGVYFGKLEFISDSGNRMSVNRKMILEK